MNSPGPDPGLFIWLGQGVPRLRPPLRLDHRVHDVVFAPNRGVAWITSGESDRVTIVDPSTGAALRTFAAGRAPQHVAFSAASELQAGWVTSGNDGMLREVDPRGRTLSHQAIPVGSYNIDATWRPLTPSLDRGTLASPVTTARRDERARRRPHHAGVSGPTLRG